MFFAKTATFLMAVVMSFVSAPPEDSPCIPRGGTTPVGPFKRPPLVGHGMPVGAIWAGGNPETGQGGDGNPSGIEDDATSFDDSMGDAVPAGNPSGSEATVAVENKGGNLSGPNGTVQNGGVEGPCIEVKVRWTYLYPKTTTFSIGISIGGEGGPAHWHAGAQGSTGWTWTQTTWIEKTVDSEPIVVCPC